MRTRRHRVGIWIVASCALLLIALVPAASANTLAVIQGPDAQARCTTSYPGVSGPDELSSCQWDMPVINAGAASRPSRPAKA